MSENRAVDILEQIEDSSPIPVKTVYEARAHILNLARDMDEEGVIHIKKDLEEYV